tara:strand:+ start:32538 stop:32687 length:150 start_codon:yes stop_codon:yes gene_type:complete
MKKYNCRKLGVFFVGTLFAFSPLALSSISLDEVDKENTEFFLEKYKAED